MNGKAPGLVATSNRESRWYPTTEQMRDPSAMERTLRRILQLHYSLQDRYDTLTTSHATLQASHAALQQRMTSAPPPGSGPADSMLLGLHVGPVDTNTLANGASLKYVKASGNFQFS